MIQVSLIMACLVDHAITMRMILLLQGQRSSSKGNIHMKYKGYSSKMSKLNHKVKVSLKQRTGSKVKFKITVSQACFKIWAYQT